MHLLIVEDDPYVAEGVSRAMSKSGYTSDIEADGLSAEVALFLLSYDLVILDLQLPTRTGTDVLRNYRAGGGRAPVLILSARSDVADRVGGLDTGADDYLTKPFDLAELEARVRALLRRANAALIPVLRHGTLTLDTVGRHPEIDGEGVYLSGPEITVLETLLLRAGWVVSKQELLESSTVPRSAREKMRSKCMYTVCVANWSPPASSSVPSAALDIRSTHLRNLESSRYRNG
jgi:DNA-binding response OmpR family regulator